MPVWDPLMLSTAGLTSPFVDGTRSGGPPRGGALVAELTPDQSDALPLLRRLRAAKATLAANGGTNASGDSAATVTVTAAATRGVTARVRETPVTPTRPQRNSDPTASASASANASSASASGSSAGPASASASASVAAAESARIELESAAALAARLQQRHYQGAAASSLSANALSERERALLRAGLQGGEVALLRPASLFLLSPALAPGVAAGDAAERAYRATLAETGNNSDVNSASSAGANSGLSFAQKLRMLSGDTRTTPSAQIYSRPLPQAQEQAHANLSDDD